MKTLILSEENLIKHCIKGDRKAQETLYDRFYNELYAIGKRYLVDQQDTEDAIIQAFVKIFNGLDKFKYQGEGSLGRWIRTILINESIKQLNRRKAIQFDLSLEHIQLESESANGLEQMQAEDLLRMIEQMPTGYRMVFNLYVIEGYSHREIAKALNISENTSKTQLMKARRTLMIRLKKERNYGVQ